MRSGWWWRLFSVVFLLLQALKAAPWCPLSILWRHCTTHFPSSRWTISSTGCVRAAAKLTSKPWRVKISLHFAFDARQHLNVKYKHLLCISAVLSSLFDSQSQSSLYSPQCPLSSSGSETSLRPPSQKVWRECGIALHICIWTPQSDFKKWSDWPVIRLLVHQHALIWLDTGILSFRWQYTLQCCVQRWSVLPCHRELLPWLHLQRLNRKVPGILGWDMWEECAFHLPMQARTHMSCWPVCLSKYSWILWPLREFAVAAG